MIHIKRWHKIVLVCVLAGILFAAWSRYCSPTRIAVINYRDFQFAQMLDADQDYFIQLKRLERADIEKEDLSDYAATFIFGMGLRLDDSQAEQIRSGITKGAKVYVHSSTSKDDEFTSLNAEEIEQIELYLKNGGSKNLQSLFHYCRKFLDKKFLFVGKINSAEEIPMDTLFHLDREDFFKSPQEYQSFYEESGKYRQNQPKVCLLTSIIGPRDSKRDTISTLIERLENQNLNVYPVAGFRKRLEFMKEIKPDLVVYFPHGRLNMMGNTNAVIDWLKEQNIPLLCPLTVHEPYETWMNSQNGMAGGMLSQSIVMPELDGGIEPFAVSAEFPDKQGLMVSMPIEKRMDTFVRRITNWLKLKDIPNHEKKVVIVYFKGPGKNALVASGMEVSASLLNVLKHLKDQGYETGLLPESVEQLEERITNEGPVLGAYAKGEFEKYLNYGNPELIKTEDYLSWVQEQLEPELYQQVEQAYGLAPGSYLSIVQDGQSYIALPRVQFGNIVILPQLPPGIGDDHNKLVHGVKQAPPHPYIATYLWAKHGFKADALVHFGTHGSLEFTPWKQNALSQMDWADALMGDLPHPYVYVINNIGEAVIAKRRSYATMVSHLTPPFMESELYGPLSELEEAVHGYLHGEDQALREEYAKSITIGVKELDIHKDLGFTDFENRSLTQEEMERLHDYLHNLAIEKITRGCYVLGRPYTEAFAHETAALMALEPITYALVRLDQAHAEGHAHYANHQHHGPHRHHGAHSHSPDIQSQTHQHAEHGTDELFRPYAAQIIEKILSGQSTWQEYVTPADLARLEAWDKANTKKRPAGVMRMNASKQSEKKEKLSPSMPAQTHDEHTHMPNSDKHHHEHNHGDSHAFEWVGVYSLQPGTYTWTCSKVKGTYADPAMKVVILPCATADRLGYSVIAGQADELLFHGTGNYRSHESELTPGPQTHTLVFDTARDVTAYQVRISTPGFYAVFTEHMPHEFQTDEHYFKNDTGQDIKALVTQTFAGAHGHSHNHSHEVPNHAHLSPADSPAKVDGPPHSEKCTCSECVAWGKTRAAKNQDDAEIVVDPNDKIAQHQAWVSQACQPNYREILFQTADLESYHVNVAALDIDHTEQHKKILEFYAEHTDLSEEVAIQSGKDNKALAALLRLGRAHIERALKLINQRESELEESECTYIEAVRNLRDALRDVTFYRKQLQVSSQEELKSLTRSLSGGYVPPSTGGDAIRNPKAVPTGRNLTAINMDKTPTRQSWKVGVKLADSTIQNKLAKTGQYPKKIAVTLWGGELIRAEGTQIAMIFHFLGVEPVRNSRGIVHDIRLVPMKKLQRPRIDVIVQTSGQARDIAASRLFLIHKAVKLASEANDGDEYENYVKAGTIAAEKVMKERGLSPMEARNYSTARVFGGVNGNYGSNIMGLVESGDRWEDDTEITNQYIKNMGAIYTEDNWGHYEPGIFEAALQNTDTIVHSRSSNTWGPLSLDHVYEFMGSMNAVVRNITGNEPDAMFSDLRNPHNPIVQGAKEAIWTESRTTLLNPKYIKAMQVEGSSAAESFAETFRNTYAWNILKPEAVDNELWKGLYDVYVEDSLDLKVQEFFKDKNPYALQEMTAVMLETIRKGYWEADQEVIDNLADLHVELVAEYEPGCSGFVCDNAKLRQMIAERVSPHQSKSYKQQIEQVRIAQVSEAVEGMKLERQDLTISQIKQTIARNKWTMALLLVVIIVFIVAVLTGARRRHQ